MLIKNQKRGRVVNTVRRKTAEIVMNSRKRYDAAVLGTMGLPLKYSRIA
jgi:hypothetical protein